MAFTFDLVQALNNIGTGSLAIFGNFSAGRYNNNSYSQYEIFNTYGYIDGTPFTGLPYLASELGWYMSGNNRPHIGIENINGNINIDTNIYTQSIYWHPGGTGTWTSSTNIPCVIRFTPPFNGTLGALGNFVKGNGSGCGGSANASFVIKKNGVDIITRNPLGISAGALEPINLSNLPVSIGDNIDFILDNGLLPFCRDSAITLQVEVTPNKTSTPVITTTPIGCNTTVINGIVEFAQIGTDVTIKTSSETTIASTTITSISGVNGNFQFTELNLSAYAGQTLEIVSTSFPSTISDSATFIVQNIGCCTAVSGGLISGSTTVVSGISEIYTITGLTGTAPFNYVWNVINGTLVSGQGTASAIITPTSAGTTVQCMVNNCSNTGTVTLTKNLIVKVNCTPTVYCKSNCWTIVSTTGTLSGVTEANRVISTTPTSITFNAEVGTHDYTFILTDTNSIQHQVTYKNIIC